MLVATKLEALFTWSRQMEPVEAGLIPTGELRFCISKRLRSQWDIQIDPSNLEFRFCDLDGDTFQVSNDMTILQLLEEYRPEWRLRQYKLPRILFAHSGYHTAFRTTSAMLQN